MKIIWSQPAIFDLENIRDYIAKDSLRYSLIFIERIIVAIEKMAQFPLAGRIVPEYATKSIREVIYQHYRIIYKINGKAVYILTVVHGGRDLKGWR
jgi:toxin ParE1/3/4